MRRTERLFHLLERLRSARKPITAQQLSDELEVSVRTIYRDIKLLELQGLPISGEAGIGYMLSSGFNAPPLQFTQDELEILSIGLRIVFREGDVPMRRSAETILSKIQAGLNGSADFEAIDLFAVGTPSEYTSPILTNARRAIRNRKILDIEYQRLDGELTQRRVKPLALLFFHNATLLAGYCELRQDFRNFRVDLIRVMKESREDFKSDHYRLRRAYFESVRKEQRKDTKHAISAQ